MSWIMNRTHSVLLATGLALGLPAAQVSLWGVLVDTHNVPVAGALVKIGGASVTTTSGTDGGFRLASPAGIGDAGGLGTTIDLAINGKRLFLARAAIGEEVSITAFDMQGVRVGGYRFQAASSRPVPVAKLLSNASSQGVFLLRLSIGVRSIHLRLNLCGDASAVGEADAAYGTRPLSKMARSALTAVAGTLTISAPGYVSRNLGLDSLTMGDLDTICLVPTSIRNPILISYPTGVPQTAFGISRLDSGAIRSGATPIHLGGARRWADIQFRSVPASANVQIKPEGFEIRNAAGAATVAVNAVDSSGMLYGMLEIGERLSMGKGLTGLTAGVTNPRFPFRAIKFNLPFTSYRTGAALQQHTATVKDLKFWSAFLDMMAENRYNALTIWSLHPWPYMIKPTNFPRATPFSDAELADWKNLWQGIFRMAKERGIKTYMVTWNIFVSEAFKANYDNNAFTDADFTGAGTATEQVRRYNRECITQVINEYPDLTGLGTAAGDRMGNLDPQKSQDWITDVYYNGMKAAQRQVEFIHRAAFRGTNADVITRNAIEAANIAKPIYSELKFNWSHALSTPKLIQIQTDNSTQSASKYISPAPTKYKIAWMIRNEDIFVLRWGQADFIRKHIALNGQNYVAGYFYGSETYIPALDYIHQPGHPHVNWKYEFERKWLQWMEWGRLLYDPNTPDAVFEAAFDRRYGPGTGKPMFSAFEAASLAPFRFGCIARSTWDFSLRSEGFMKSSFFTLDQLIAETPFDPGYMGIKEYVNAGKPATSSKITPAQLADELEGNAAKALSLLATLPSSSSTLECEKDDVQFWANYGLYFAKKIRGGIAKAEGNASVSKSFMQEALGYWKEMIRINGIHNRESITDLQNGTFSWQGMLNQVQAEAQ